MHGTVLQLCFWVLAFIALYAMGFRGWELFLFAFLGGIALVVVLAGPLDRIIPPLLEPFEAPFWALPRRTGKSVLGLSDGENTSSDRQNIEPADQPSSRDLRR
jgi:hypothetical protein